jgi:hypothetical protein
MIVHLHSWLHGVKYLLRIHELLSYSKMSQHFMEPEGSLPFHKTWQMVPSLKQMNPVYTTQSSLSKSQIDVSIQPKFKSN